jgi:hypothetical protein
MLTNCSLIIKTKRTGVNGVISKWISWKWVWRMWIVFNGSGKGPVAGYCRHGKPIGL